MQCTKDSLTNLSQCRVGDGFARVDSFGTYAVNAGYNPSLSTHYHAAHRHNSTTTEEMQRSSLPHLHVLLNANGVPDKAELIAYYMSKYVTKTTTSETASNNVENNEDEEEELEMID